MSKIPLSPCDINIEHIDGQHSLVITVPEKYAGRGDKDVTSAMNALVYDIKNTRRTTKEIATELEEKAATKSAKTLAIHSRRKAFQYTRAQSILKMIESGMEYMCAHPNCKEIEFLTVDHIYPLSRGGGDEIENLQFLCSAHNRDKSDNVI